MGLIGVAVHELFVFCLLSPYGDNREDRYGDNREDRERVKGTHLESSSDFKKFEFKKSYSSRHGNMLGWESKSSGEEFRIHSSPELFNPSSPGEKLSIA